LTWQQGELPAALLQFQQYRRLIDKGERKTHTHSKQIKGGKPKTKKIKKRKEAPY
jgi:hypothetical protein